jgi:hypothetical protein
MKVKGEVVETLLIKKEVEVEVPDGSTPDVIDEAIRDEAYKAIITDPDAGGWELVETMDVEVSFHDPEGAKSEQA